MKKALLFIGFATLLSFSTPNQQEEDRIITLRLPLSKVNIVLKGIAKLPLEESQDTYMAIIQQAQPQLQAKDTIQKKK